MSALEPSSFLTSGSGVGVASSTAIAGADNAAFPLMSSSACPSCSGNGGGGGGSSSGGRAEGSGGCTAVMPSEVISLFPSSADDLEVILLSES